MEIEVLPVGSLSRGSQTNATSPGIGAFREVLIGALVPPLYEAAYRGNIFFAADGTGIAPQQTISTTAPLCLYNPQGSAVDLVPVFISMGYLSGTLANGVAYLCGNPTPTQTAPSGGTALTVVSGKLAVAAASPQGNVGVPRVGGTVVAPTPMLPLFWFGDTVATDASGPSPAQIAHLNGSVVVKPGCSVQVQTVTAGAGTSPLVVFGIAWLELLT